MDVRRLAIATTFVSLLIAVTSSAAAGDPDASQGLNNADAAKGVAQAQDRLARASAEHRAAAQRLQAGLDMSERELHGEGNSPPGAGPRYRIARSEVEVARGDLTRTAAEIILERSRLDRARAELAREPIR
jgi:hypothetical protein